MRIALLVFALLAAALLALLAEASANTSLFAEWYPALLAANAVAALALLVLVGIQVRKLWRELRAAVFGSRLKSRLLAMLALMAVIPGALVYVVSMQFAVNSIDSWFDVRVDAALEGGLSLGRDVLDKLQNDTLSKARDIALELAPGEHVNAAILDRLRDQAGIDTAAVLSLDGAVLAAATGSVATLLPPLPDPAQLRKARVGRGFVQLQELGGDGLLVRALVPLANLQFGAEPRVLQLTANVPPAIVASARNVERAHREYQELQLASSGLKRLYTLTLTLALLLALFAAVGVAFFLAERLARPLLILAEGTQAVAAGDFTPRATVGGKDELGILTRSFRSMTEQLADARRVAESRRTALEAAQSYLESVLTNLSAGVLAFDARHRLRAANRGAMTILGDDLGGFEDFSLEHWPRHELLARTLLEAFSRDGGDWQRQLEIQHADGRVQVLLLQGSALPEDGGFVVVFDDISKLIAAQRSVAWGEVARRLAHEIKNPLTPIQLSAERLQHKLADRLDGDGRRLLDRATSTIVNQVEAMKSMVNEFRDYARLPPPSLEPTSLSGVVEDVLGLYGASRATIEVRYATGEVAVSEAAPPAPRDGADAVPPAPSLAGELPLVLADPNQIRQVLHNLLTNAQDALVGNAAPRIEIELAREGRRARLTVRDNGPGFAPEVLARAFEPYVTTKVKGTGLGLAIVKKIVDDHGGEIRVGNHAGGGAVDLWLPLVLQNA